MAKRRNFSAAFKAKMVIEALRGDRTLAELASKDYLGNFRSADDSGRRHDVSREGLLK